MTHRSSQARRPRLRLVVESLEDRELLDAAGLASAEAYRPDRLLVRFQEDAARSIVVGAGLAPGMTVGARFDAEPGLYEIDLSGVSVADALSWVNGYVPGVAFAQPDYLLTTEAVPNDSLFGNQWALRNTGQNAGTPSADIDAVAAWDTFRGSGQMVVAVIDTGIDYTHPDLAGNMWHNPGEIPGNGIDDDGDGFVDDVYGCDFVNNDANPMDDNHHGTHVAGIIGAVGNNGVGVSGAAWDVQLMALKILNSLGSGYSSDAVRALNFAVAHGAKVVNNSWGGAPYDAALNAAIQNARGQGVIVVAAAGNNSRNIDLAPFYPASYQADNMVRVAATDNHDALAPYSNWGANSVQIAAPGTYILSTLPNNSYGYLSGTSMAAPCVSAALALAWDEHSTWTYSQVIDRILSTVDVLPALATKVGTSGRLNLARALEGGGGPPPPPPPDTDGPRVLGMSALTNSSGIYGLRLTFNEAIDPTTFTTADVIALAGPSGAIAPGGVAPVAGTATQFDVTFAARTTVGSYSLTIGPAIGDVAGNLMNQNQNTANGESPGDRYSGAVNYGSGGGTTYSATGLPKAIPDNQTISSALTVGSSLTITDVNVKVNISHTWDNDVRLRLRGPTGAEVVLVDRRGGSGRNFTDTVFDDQSALPISQGSAPFANSFHPEGNLSAFNGTNARGYWTLFVDDKAVGNVGTLNSWSITFNSGIGTTSAGGEGRETHGLGWMRGLVGLLEAKKPAAPAMFSRNAAADSEQWSRSTNRVNAVVPVRAAAETKTTTSRTRIAEQLLKAFGDDSGLTL